MASIEYSIIRRPKRKTAAIVVRPDNRIEVLAPSHMPGAMIEHFVQEKQNWIRRKLYFNNEIRTPHRPKTFTDAEQFMVLGRQYRLRLQPGRPHVALKDDLLLVNHYRNTNLEKLLTSWYCQLAQMHFQQRCSEYAPPVGRSAGSVEIKNYKSRWGSCHPNGRICFNWRLIMAPEWIIDYVVVHELCHLVHPNHSKAYWQLVESIMPDYRDARQWLKINGMSLSL